MIATESIHGTSSLYNLRDSGSRAWSSRAEAAVELWKEFLTANSHCGHSHWNVADLGCGDEKLRIPLSHSGISYQYTGYDKLPQSPNCRPLDLANEAPDGNYDLIFCLGVLEYLADVPNVLAKLRRTGSWAVFSYVLADSHIYSPDDVAAKGWLHHFTAAEMESMFARAGYSIRNSARIDDGRTGLWLLESNNSTLSPSDYAMLTPYPIPEELKTTKIANLGDGFIERAIGTQLQPHNCRVAYSGRVPLTDEAIERINETKLLILVGANQLNDNFTITPGMTPERFARIRVPVLPVGMGIHGIASFNRAMSPITKTLLRLMHERIRYSSWRCPRTVEYLLRHQPDLRDQALMTGCPVIFGVPLMHCAPFTTSAQRIVVTVTERDNFWKREAQTIDFVGRRFPQATKTLSLHQVYPRTPHDDAPLTWSQRLFGGPKTPNRLSDYARSRGFEVHAPRSVAECQEFYNSRDLHFGSRLHAHLYFLSQAKRSYLSYVDDRSAGLAQATNFPLCQPNKWHRHSDYDFENYRTAARRCYQSMARFNLSARELLVA